MRDILNTRDDEKRDDLEVQGGREMENIDTDRL